MLLHGWDLFVNDPLAFLTVLAGLVLALLVSITVHEFSHAMVADRLGDPTPRRAGRLTLDPRAHLDAAGSLMILVIGFGWGKPVPVNAAYLRNGRAGMALVAASGPLSNLALAAVLALAFRADLLGPGGYVAALAFLLLRINLVLAVFNLLPVAPLDGSRVAFGLLPLRLAVRYTRVESYLVLGFILVVALDLVLNLGIIRAVLGPPVDFLQRALLG